MPQGNNRNGGKPRPPRPSPNVNDNRHFVVQDWMIVAGIGAFILVLVILLA